jgi:hypothetical protein
MGRFGPGFVFKIGQDYGGLHEADTFSSSRFFPRRQAPGRITTRSAIRLASRPRQAIEHEPETWTPVFPRDVGGTRLRGDHAQKRKMIDEHDSTPLKHALDRGIPDCGLRAWTLIRSN